MSVCLRGSARQPQSARKQQNRATAGDAHRWLHMTRGPRGPTVKKSNVRVFRALCCRWSSDPRDVDDDARDTRARPRGSQVAGAAASDRSWSRSDGLRLRDGVGGPTGDRAARVDDARSRDAGGRAADAEPPAKTAIVSATTSQSETETRTQDRTSSSRRNRDCRGSYTACSSSSSSSSSTVSL